MPSLYPLRFEPRFRNYLWGGRRLGEVLGKPIGEGPNWAESWEVVDHDQEQSVVAVGPLAGQELGQLMRTQGRELLGQAEWERVADPARPPHLRGRFPLLLKFLDAQQALSVQVHPDDALARTQDPPDLGKTEAWVVLDCQPDSLIYAGLRDGVGEAELREAMQAGRTESVLHAIQPAVGDSIFIPAGTVHAIGAGLLIAEIQQASDTTYRLFDWNRLGPDGQPRALHIEQGFQAIDFQRGPIQPQVPRPTDQPHVSRLVDCDKFRLDRCRIGEPTAVGGDGHGHLLAVVEGAVRVSGDATGRPLGVGQTMLLPEVCGAVEVTPAPAAVVLDIAVRSE